MHTLFFREHNRLVTQVSSYESLSVPPRAFIDLIFPISVERIEPSLGW